MLEKFFVSFIIKASPLLKLRYYHSYFRWIHHQHHSYLIYVALKEENIPQALLANALELYSLEQENNINEHGNLVPVT